MKNTKTNQKKTIKELEQAVKANQRHFTKLRERLESYKESKAAEKIINP